MIGDTTITLLQRLFTLMNSSAGPHAIFAGIADTALTMLVADSVAIFEYDSLREAFSIAAARNLSPQAQAQVMQALTRRARDNETWLTHLQLIRNWGRQLQSEAESGSIAEDMRGMAGMITVPLRAGQGELLGLLAVFYETAEVLTGRQQVLAALLGGLAAVSLENACLYARERYRADFLAEVLRFGDVLQVDQSLDSILQQVVSIISTTLGWQTVMVMLVHHETGDWRLAAWVTHDPLNGERLERAAAHEPIPRAEDCPWRRAEFKISRSYFVDHRLPAAADVIAALQADPFLMRSGSPDPAPVSTNQWHPDDLLLTPLIYRGFDLGWLSVASPRDLRHPTLMGIQELEVFADQLAQAVVNTYLYNEAEHERLTLTTVLDGIVDGVLAFDPQHRLLFSNRAVERLLGKALPTIPGARLDEVLEESPLLDFLKEEVTATRCGELYMTGTGRRLAVQVTPLPFMGCVAVLHDVTSVHEMEQVQLRLLNNLSHDLGSPLTTVHVAATLLERSGGFGDEQREYVGRLRSAAQYAVHLVSDLLDMARLEAGERLAREICSLADLCGEAVAEMQSQADARRIRLVCEVGELPAVRGDASRLRQALVNLIGSAIRFAPDEGQVTVSATVSKKAVTVSVQGSGQGIAEKHLPYLFDRFYRVNPRSADSGTGLELAMAKAVVEHHGGRMWAHSAEGQGSTFFFTLPLEPPVLEP